MYLIHSKKEMEINYFLLMDDECEISFEFYIFSLCYSPYQYEQLD